MCTFHQIHTAKGCTLYLSALLLSGFNNAMISNLGMVLRNIYSKKSLINYKVTTRAEVEKRGC